MPHLTILILLIAALTTSFVGAAPRYTQSANQAGVVVLFGDGSVRTQCVAFDEPALTGFELIQRANLQLSTEISGGSAKVCKIEQDGCAFPGESCFCQCKGGGSCRYWAYWQLGDADWEYSNVGASDTRIQHGAVDGWGWGGGSVITGSKPPVISFDQICAVPIRATAAVASQPTIKLPTIADQVTLVPTVTTGPLTTVVEAAPATVAPMAATSDGRPPAVAPTPVAGQRPANYAFFIALLTGLLLWIIVVRRRRV